CLEDSVQNPVKAPDPATLLGLERRFAERLEIQPSYWSQIKSRSRLIGERLARQFEQCCHKPVGWMDEEHFTTGLVLTYYRRHPQRARTRLLDLLGEVLMPAVEAAAPPPAVPAAP